MEYPWMSEYTSPTYRKAALLALPLFACLWIPGAVVTTALYLGARRQRRRFGQRPAGMRLLAIEFWALTVVPILVLLGSRATIPLHQNIVVAGTWMAPTLAAGDRILANVTLAPTRGRIVIFRNPLATGQFVIGRVLATPGDIVRLSDGTLLCNGHAVATLVLPPGARHAYRLAPFTVPAGTVLVWGDNRGDVNQFFSPISDRLITGEAWLRYYHDGHLEVTPL